MRYTTIIDVTEVPEVWRNPNICRLYLWMVLKAGYHDNDRDQLKHSLRTMAQATGLSLSAVRNAMKVLAKTQLIASQGGVMIVTKFVMDQTISKRAKNKAQQEQQDAAAERRRQQEKIDRQLAEERRKREHPTPQEEEELAEMYEEFSANPNSVVRKTFLRMHENWYTEYRKTHPKRT